MIVVANYKMNLTLKEYRGILKSINNNQVKDTELVLCPPFVYLPYFNKNKTWFKLGAQDVSAHKAGEHTGQISANMLKDFNVSYSLVGHCERREFETDLEIANKVSRLASAGIVPIICVGENNKGEEDELIIQQLKNALSKIDCKAECIIAYEPVWAIKTRQMPEINYINKKVAIIKKEMKKLGFNKPILYGGGIDENNFTKLKRCKIDGLLVGGLALNPERFVEFLRGV